MNLRLLLILILFAFCNDADAQGDFFNSDEYWENIQLDSSIITSQVSKSDTVIIVASNRTMQNGQLRFMGEDRDDQNVRYFIVYSFQHKWHVLQTKDLNEAISYVPDKNLDWVVYTEGMGKIFTSDLDRGMRMAGTYHVNVILLDYPSAKTKYHLFHNYRFAILNAKIAYHAFFPVLDTIKEMKLHNKLGNDHLTLFFHSMGNNVMREIVNHNLLPAINNKAWVDNLILNAPCVPQKNHRKWVDKIHFAKSTYIHYNPNDKTLKGAHLISFKKQLGEKIKAPVSNNANYVDFELIAGERHSNFLTLLGHPPVIKAVIDYYKIVLHGDTPNFHDTILYSHAHIGYNLLPQKN